MTGLDARDRFRTYALDGAVHHFHPRTGTHVRVTGPRTRDVRRAAPRVVMFGITNACNLACTFCSRDPRRESRWTMESAFEVLRDLSVAGALEVAFGGGEPFVFPRFGDLIARLHEETLLVPNVTTNGTLLDRASWAPFAGRFGQVRVSIYGDRTWRRCAELFAATGQRWGANILVDDAAIAALPATLADLAAAGCHDVSLLGYIGEPTRLLSPRARRELADAAVTSPVPCRLSVCFGSSLEVPRLLAGFANNGDCGAGGDFITVTPDQRVQSCSFQDDGFPGATAAEILTAWRTQRVALARPSSRSGCARLRPEDLAPAPLPEIAIWQGFSGNNSGECVLVAKFQTVADARAYLDELLPGWKPNPGSEEQSFPAAWNDLFSREQVAGAAMLEGYRSAPEELMQFGKSVLATGYGLDDNFPELRALAWKRGARVLPGGIHVHEPLTLFGAIAARDERDRDELVRAASAAALPAHIHGRTVFVQIPPPTEGPRSVQEQADRLRGLAAGRPLAAEVSLEPDEEDITDALKRLGHHPPERQRLWIHFFPTREGDAETRRLAGALTDQQVVVGSNWLLVDPVLGRKRVAVLAYRHEAAVRALDAETVILDGYLWQPPPPPQRGKKAEPPPAPTIEALQAALAARAPLFHAAKVEDTHGHANALRVTLHTGEPGPALQALESVATQLALTLWPSLSDPTPIAAMLRRLQSDLDQD